MQSSCLYVRLFVCLSARISIDPHIQITRGFLYTLPVFLSRSSSDNNAIRYVLPALCVTSSFHIIDRISQKLTELVPVHQLFCLQLRTFCLHLFIIDSSRSMLLFRLYVLPCEKLIFWLRLYHAL